MFSQAGSSRMGNSTTASSWGRDNNTASSSTFSGTNGAGYAHSTAGAGSDDEDNYVSLVWGGEKMRIPLPPPDAPLSALRAAIQERTGVAPEHQKLIVGGAVMQKDLPLKTYGLVKPSLRDDLYGKQEEDQSRMPSMGMRSLLSKWGLGNTPAAGKKNQELRITMIASKDASAVVRDRGDGTDQDRQGLSAREQALPAAASSSTSRQQGKKQSQQPLDEPRVIAQMDSIVTSTLEKLKEPIENVLRPTASSTDKEINKQYLMVSEVLLQALMKLDGFEIDSSWTEARKARKEAIRKVQALLDDIDAAKENRQSSGNSIRAGL